LQILKNIIGESFKNSELFFGERRRVFTENSETPKEQEAQKNPKDQRSDIFNAKQDFEIIDWIDSSWKKLENLTYWQYLQKSLSEIGTMSWLFSALENKDIPRSLKKAIKDKLEWRAETDMSEEEKAAFKVINEDSAMKEHFEKLKDKNFEDWKQSIINGLNSNVSKMEFNLGNFSESIKQSKTEKHNKLKSKIWKSRTLDLLSDWFDKEAGVFDQKIWWLRWRFWADWIKDMFSKPEYLEEYLKNMINSIRKETNLSVNEYDACILSNWSVNTTNAIQVIEKYFQADDWWKTFFSPVEQDAMKLRAWNSALEKINKKYFDEFKRDFSDTESSLDMILGEYDEYIKLAENPKDKNDCEEVLKNLPIPEGYTKELIEAMNTWIDEFVQRISELNPDLPTEDFKKIKENIYWENWKFSEISKDPLFWTIMYNEFLKAEEHFYKEIMHKEDELDDNWTWISWNDLNKKSPEDCDNAFTKILWWKSDNKDGWDDKKWLLKEAYDLFEAKKWWIESPVMIKNFLDEIGNWLQSAHSLNEKLKKNYNSPGKTDRERKGILKRMRANSRIAFDSEDVLEDRINQLNGVENNKNGIEIKYYSLADIASAYENITTFFDERYKEKSKMNGHELARNVSKNINDQLSNAQAAEQNRAYDWLVNKWKESLEKTSVPNLNKRLHEATIKKIDNDELEAIISMLAKKWMLQYDNENLLKALNKQLYSSEQINLKSFYKLDFPWKQKLLKPIFKRIFNWSDTVFQEIDDENTKTFTDTANWKAAEITKMGPWIWRREFEIYSDYMKIAKEQGAIHEKTWQIKKWKVADYDEGENIDPMLLEEWIFYAIKEAASKDINTMMFYLIRWFASWLLPVERLSQIEDRWTYNDFWQLNSFRGITLDEIKKLDLDLTDNGDYKDLDPEKPFMRERINQFMEKMKNKTENHKRIVYDVNESQSMDKDLWQTMWDHIDYSTMEKSIFAKRSWGARLDDIAWGNFISSYSTHLYHFWKDTSWEDISSEEIDNNSVKYMIWAMKSFLAVDSAKVVWNYKSTSTSWDYWKIDSTSLKEDTPNMAEWTTKIWQHAWSVRFILQEAFWEMAGWNAILDKIYNTDDTYDYFQWWQWDFSSEFDDLFLGEKEEENTNILIKIIKKYQDLWKIPTYYKDAKVPITEQEFKVVLPDRPKDSGRPAPPRPEAP